MSSKRRIKELSDDFYNDTFSMLDSEYGIDGMTAGKIATSLQQALEKELEDHFYIQALSEYEKTGKV